MCKYLLFTVLDIRIHVLNFSVLFISQVLIEYKNKDANHVEWAKALKELYLPGLRDYVKCHYPLGPVWGTSANATVSVAPKASPRTAPAAPTPPPASLFTSDTAKPSSSQPKTGMSAVFSEISSGSLTSGSCFTHSFSLFFSFFLLGYLFDQTVFSLGLRKVTDDMKAKNRADRSGVVPVIEKEQRAKSAFSKTGPPKLELQMGRK